MKKKIIGIFVCLLLICTVLPTSGKVNLNKNEIVQQHFVGSQEVAVATGDDVEIYIYAGDETNDPVGPSYGFQVNIKVTNLWETN